MTVVHPASSHGRSALSGLVRPCSRRRSMSAAGAGRVRQLAQIVAAAAQRRGQTAAHPGRAMRPAPVESARAAGLRYTSDTARASRGASREPGSPT